MILHLRLIGCMMLVLAAVHVVFPLRFNWKTELLQVSLLNRQLMEVHTFFVALVVALNGIFLLVNAADLIQPSPLGTSLALGMLVFWGLRLFFQFFVYSPTLWRGKPFETRIHLVFILTWLYFSGIFAWLVLLQFS